MGNYQLIFFLLCVIPHIQWKTASRELYRSPKTAKLLRITEIRSDGIIFEWDKRAHENKFTITVTPESSSKTTPWTKSCSEKFICNSDKTCSRDTKDILRCIRSVPGCSQAKITVSAGGTQAHINVVTGPSSGEYIINKGRMPDYTPKVVLHTLEKHHSKGTFVSATWEGPASEPSGLCADKVLIQTIIDGKYDPKDDIIQTVVFNGLNFALLRMPDTNSDVEVMVKVTYLVSSENLYRATDVSGYAAATFQRQQIGNTDRRPKSGPVGAGSGDSSGWTARKIFLVILVVVMILAFIIISAKYGLCVWCSFDCDFD